MDSTATTARPRRSVLYLPASNLRALEKAATLPVDALILDLEDAVAPDAKPLARSQACQAASSGNYGERDIAIRINGLATQWGKDDLAAVAAAKPYAVLIPKVDDADALRSIAAELDRQGAKDTRIWAMMETTRGMLNAASIAAAHERLEVLVMGTNDLARELRVQISPTRAALHTSLQLCLLAARTHGKVIVDGVYNDVRNLDGFTAECRQGAEFGFDGKTLIHPSQVEPCNQVFSPSERELTEAREIVLAFEAAVREGKGVITVGGRMIENLHVDHARRILHMAELLARRAPSAV
jgi:citrate lyase subunit beta / citryl-CoA lyase